ncbi:hypothetical protein [Alkaliphilus peptidifermentans]|uniref:Lipoprotein n=1 Tax=Alkaliphilus peptidifermentans DSM 18978 TaxID=1120976 RepID=A0A1G5KTA2_9FIRM|nr:hypothetical protein [Alkaliphilus peptidifermentans]SCZ03348.1 hypothetical protein SAMN03080606_03730 [Alkaliphilus peptidifermentans DSM 18978]
MTIRRVMLLFLILLFSIVGFGCSNQNEPPEEEKSTLRVELVELVELRKEIMQLEQEKEFAIFQIKQFTETNISKEEIIQEQVYIFNILKEENKEYIILPIYNANMDTYDREISYYIYLPSQISLEEKITVLAEKLSKFSFRSLPIEIKGIETIDNKSIVVVNIQEPEDESSTVAWDRHYFQGTSGGTMTATRLIETFLQREYEGQWVDGVKLLYNNTPSREFDHVGNLFSTHYRD